MVGHINGGYVIDVDFRDGNVAPASINLEFYYNRTRSHSYLGNLSPKRFEEVNKMLQMEMVA